MTWIFVLYRVYHVCDKKKKKKKKKKKHKPTFLFCFVLFLLFSPHTEHETQNNTHICLLVWVFVHLLGYLFVCCVVCLFFVCLFAFNLIFLIIMIHIHYKSGQWYRPLKNFVLLHNETEFELFRKLVKLFRNCITSWIIDLVLRCLTR